MVPRNDGASIAEGRRAVHGLFAFVRDHSRRLDAHPAENGAFRSLLPIRLAAMKTYFAERGAGEVDPTILRALLVAGVPVQPAAR